MPRSFSSIRIIASLIKSAAAPCSGVFTAVRSAKLRALGLRLLHVGNGPPPAEQVDATPAAPHLRDGLVQPPAHAGVALEVGADVQLGFPPLDAQRWSPGRTASARRRFRNLRPWRCGALPAPTISGGIAEHFGGGAGVDILAVAERVHQHRVARHDAPAAAARSANNRRRSASIPAAARRRRGFRGPIRVRIGMFCRFGLEDDSRPVAAPAWLKVVCSALVRGIDQQPEAHPRMFPLI